MVGVLELQARSVDKSRSWMDPSVERGGESSIFQLQHLSSGTQRRENDDEFISVE